MARRFDEIHFLIGDQYGYSPGAAIAGKCHQLVDLPNRQTFDWGTLAPGSRTTNPLNSGCRSLPHQFFQTLRRFRRVGDRSVVVGMFKRQ